MISLYGCGFVGGEFQRLYSEEVEVIPREERKPKSKDILYMISTTHNYHVHDRITLDVDTNLKVLCDVLEYCRDEDITFNFVSSWFVMQIIIQSSRKPWSTQDIYKWSR